MGLTVTGKVLGPTQPHLTTLIFLASLCRQQGDEDGLCDLYEGSPTNLGYCSSEPTQRRNGFGTPNGRSALLEVYEMGPSSPRKEHAIHLPARRRKGGDHTGENLTLRGELVVDSLGFYLVKKGSRRVNYDAQDILYEDFPFELPSYLCLGGFTRGLQVFCNFSLENNFTWQRPKACGAG
jgi:hypothetical protein